MLTLGGTRCRCLAGPAIYACGITPYDVTHLGHAATFVWVDTLARILRSAGTEVILCRNVTDVDDVLLAAANRAGSPYDRYAAIQQFYFDRDMAALGVTEPALQPRAHAFIGQVIALATGLLARGAAYERDGTVYFSGAAIGPQVRVSIARLRCGCRRSTATGPTTRPRTTRSTSCSGRRRTGRGGAPRQSRGQAPGGQGGRAGTLSARRWRCTPSGRLSTCTLAAPTCAFPHHAYQAALAEQFTGVTPFARARLNVGVVTVGGAKMAKSTGNLVLVSDLLAHHSAAAVRLLILDRAWRADWDYVPADLDAAARRLEMLQIAAGQPENSAAAVAAVRGRARRRSRRARPRWPSPRRQAVRQPASLARCSASGREGSSTTRSNLALDGYVVCAWRRDEVRLGARLGRESGWVRSRRIGHSQKYDPVRSDHGGSERHIPGIGESFQWDF